MAALGAISSTTLNVQFQPVLHTISNYTVVRGNHLGTITAVGNKAFFPALLLPATYIVRQLTVLYRQLWPSHGQRFPQ